MTATAAASSLPVERQGQKGETELTADGPQDVPISRERSMVTLVSVVLLVEMGWLGVIAYGLLLLAR